MSADQDMANLKAAKRAPGERSRPDARGRPAVPVRGIRPRDLPGLPRAHRRRRPSASGNAAGSSRTAATIVVVTPHTGRFFLLHRLRSALGMKLEFYGHKREGYAEEGARRQARGRRFRGRQDEDLFQVRVRAHRARPQSRLYQADRPAGSERSPARRAHQALHVRRISTPNPESSGSIRPSIRWSGSSRASTCCSSSSRATAS